MALGLLLTGCRENTFDSQATAAAVDNEAHRACDTFAAQDLHQG